MFKRDDSRKGQHKRLAIITWAGTCRQLWLAKEHKRSTYHRGGVLDSHDQHKKARRGKICAEDKGNNSDNNSNDSSRERERERQESTRIQQLSDMVAGEC